MILDESHHAAPSSGGRYEIETEFTRAIRDISGRFEHRLFLSATPRNGHSRSFSTLLELLDPHRFTRGEKADEKALKEVMIRCLKKDIRRLQGGFPERVADPIRYTWNRTIFWCRRPSSRAMTNDRRNNQVRQSGPSGCQMRRIHPA